MLDFRNYKDLNYINALCFNSLIKIPSDIDLIVCIPRSGYIFGTILGEYLRKPVVSLFDFLNNTESIKLRKASLSPDYPINVKHILLFDDAMGLGETMNTAKQKIIENNKEVKITTCVIFVEPYSVNKVDIYFQIFKDQFLPWNILKRGINRGCIDMDGFLCEDVPKGIDDDGEKYINFIKQSKQKFVPDKKLKYIVTGRLEKYRKITENWLKEHNIEYEKLIMCPAKNHEERRKINPAKYKANFYKQSDALIFIESNYNEARIINEITKKPVYCSDICEMII